MTSTHHPRSSAPARRRSTRGATVAPATPPGDPLEQLRLLKLDLQTTRESLMRVSPDTLGNADHAAWTEQIYQTSLAINALRNAALDALTAEFEAALPRLVVATKKLVDDLAVLEDATAVIQAVGSSLGIVASIAVLLS